MKWMKHDADAHADAKLRKLRLRHGPAAYGLYWYLLEMIAKEVNEHNLSFELEEDSELIAEGFGMTREAVEAAMKSMIELGLFENVEGRVFCLKMLKRIDASMLPKGEMRARLQDLKDEEPWRNHGQTMTQPWLDHVNKPTNQQTNKGRRFTPPSTDEVEEWVKEKGYTFDPLDFHAYYSSQNWRKANGQKVSDWKACCRTFQRNQKTYGGSTHSEEPAV